MTAPSPTRHRLTARFAAAVLLTCVLFQAADVSGTSWFLLLAGAVVGLTVASLPARARLDGLVVRLDHPPRVSAGEDLPVRVSVLNEGRRVSSAALLLLHTRGVPVLRLTVGRLEPGEGTGTLVRRESLERGVTSSTAVVMLARPALGVRQGVREVVVPSPFVVHPALRQRSDLPLTRAPAAGTAGRATVGTGSEVVGVREWRAGDDPARVHWRSTARCGRLTLLERASSEVEELRVILVGSDQAPGFEEALSDAATVCDRGLATGSDVTVVAWHVGGPVLGASSSRWDLLDWWATVRDTVLPDPREFGRTALAGFGPGELLVAGPADVDGGWLAAASASCPGLRLRRLAPA